MKIALIADLHANRESVGAVMAHASTQGIDRYAFLGDFVGFGADPGGVVDLVRDHVERGAIAVMGNHDAAVVQGPLPTMIPEARQVVEWTRERLDAEQLAFLAAMPMSVTDADRLFVHANAFAPADWAYVLGRMEAVRSLQSTNARFTFCGHVHDPKLFHLTGTGKIGDFVPSDGMPIPLSEQRRWLVIPGSAGQPRDGNPAACYALHDPAAGTLTHFRVPYDAQAAAKKIIDAGLPERLAWRLIRGE